jgi:hypothetical protein
MKIDTHELSLVEIDRLCILEEIIELGLHTFVEVGSALLEIRDSRLYRDTHATFEDYCRDKWAMSGSHAHRLVDAVKTIKNLKNSPIGELPTNEAQVRALTDLKPEQQREVWTEAAKTAPNGKATAKHVRKTRERIAPKKKKDAALSDCLEIPQTQPVLAGPKLSETAAPSEISSEPRAYQVDCTLTVRVTRNEYANTPDEAKEKVQQAYGGANADALAKGLKRYVDADFGVHVRCDDARIDFVTWAAK